MGPSHSRFGLRGPRPGFEIQQKTKGAPEWFVILVRVFPSPPSVSSSMHAYRRVIAGYIILLCSVVFLCYCIYLISSRSLGPKHTRIKGDDFPFFGSSVMRQTTETFHCFEGIWRYPLLHTADGFLFFFCSSHQRIQLIDRVQHSTVQLQYKAILHSEAITSGLIFKCF